MEHVKLVPYETYRDQLRQGYEDIDHVLLFTLGRFEKRRYRLDRHMSCVYEPLNNDPADKRTVTIGTIEDAARSAWAPEHRDMYDAWPLEVQDRFFNELELYCVVM